MLEQKQNQLKKKNQQFAIVFAIFFILMFFFSHQYGLKYVWLTLSVLSVFFGFLNPMLLQKPRLIWLRIGLALNKITAPVFLTLFYFLFFTPLSLIIRVFKTNNFNFKKVKKETYWISSSEIQSSMQDQF